MHITSKNFMVLSFIFNNSQKECRDILKDVKLNKSFSEISFFTIFVFNLPTPIILEAQNIILTSVFFLLLFFAVGGAYFLIKRIFIIYKIKSSCFYYWEKIIIEKFEERLKICQNWQSYYDAGHSFININM